MKAKISAKIKIRGIEWVSNTERDFRTRTEFLSLVRNLVLSGSIPNLDIEFESGDVLHIAADSLTPVYQGKSRRPEPRLTLEREVRRFLSARNLLPYMLSSSATFTVAGKELTRDEALALLDRILSSHPEFLTE